MRDRRRYIHNIYMICMYVCMYICIVCMYIYICMYICVCVAALEIQQRARGLSNRRSRRRYIYVYTHV
jgi:hypothetical protein